MERKISKILCHECYIVSSNCKNVIDYIRYLNPERYNYGKKTKPKILESMKYIDALKIIGSPKRFRFSVEPSEKSCRTI